MANHMVGVVYLFLRKGEKVLLMERKNTGYADGLYSTISGHMEPGETALQAIIREAKEEVGIDIRPEHIAPVGVMHRPGAENNQSRADFFFDAYNWTGEIGNMEPHKCSDVRWFDPEDLPENMLAYVRLAFERTNENLGRMWFDELGWENLLTK